MPRKCASSRGKGQETISKFFTAKGSRSTTNSVQVDSCDEDDLQVDAKNSNESVVKLASLSDEDGPKNKRLCSQREMRNSKHKGTKASGDAPSINSRMKARNQAATSEKLHQFQYGESSAASETSHEFKSRKKAHMDLDLIAASLSDQDNEESDDEGISSTPPSLSSNLASLTTIRPVASGGLSNVTSEQKAIKYTPLEQQVLEIKAQYPDAVLFVECGYKYRLFGEDAQIAARILKISCNTYHNFMTASIPVHRLFVHVRRVVAAGYKVGVVKQTETMHLKAAGSNKSGPFTRELTAMYTKSTLIGEDVDPLYDSETDLETSWQPNHYLMCVYEKQAESSSTQHHIGLMCVDPSTGEILYDEFKDNATYSELDNHIAHLQPVEILMPLDVSPQLADIIKGISALSETADDRMRIEMMRSDIFIPTNAMATVSEFYSTDKSQLQSALSLPKLVISCLAALSVYLKSFHLERVLSDTSILSRISQRSSHMYMNNKCLHNLQVFSNSYDGTEKGSLYWVLNHTCTKFGARLLRKWLSQPLLDVKEISARLDAVEELVNGNFCGLTNLQQIMTKLPDLERGLCSIFHRKCSLTEFCSVTKALERVKKEICGLHVTVSSTLLRTLLSDIPEYLEDVALYASQINEKAAKENDKVNLFVDVSRFPVISQRKAEIEQVKSALQDHLREIRKTVHQPGLQYVTVLQTEYLIEIKNNQTSFVPPDWTLISSTKAVSRFHSPTVVKQYRRLNELKEQLVLDVNICWQDLLDQFSSQFMRYKRAVTAQAMLDCLMSLAKTASQDSFCRPHVYDHKAHIKIKQGRHPIIDSLSDRREQFVPNETNLDTDGQRVMVISGPNMGGKSSYVRQVALISIMAQIGSFVPAQEASIGVLDAIYTRMGGSDEIFHGRSTFMVELQEAGEIMAEATDKSLVILDELGRGTSTHDGVAIAFATLEYFIQKCQCLVLFVTHFPMMSEFHQAYPSQVQNFHVTFLLNEDSKESNLNGVETVTFLYQLSEGAAEKSYGLNVARLAEIPESILMRAAQKSQELRECITGRKNHNQMFASLYHTTQAEVESTLRMYALAGKASSSS